MAMDAATKPHPLAMARDGERLRIPSPPAAVSTTA